jgi:hypothetical protein
MAQVEALRLPENPTYAIYVGIVRPARALFLHMLKGILLSY